MNKGLLRAISVCLLGAMLCVPVRGQNYRVKAERYERGIYSPETNPPSVRYAIIDLGPDIEPIRLSNSGHVLCQPAKAGKLQSRWYQGQFQELTGGHDSLLVGTLDMNDAGTVVGAILEYKTGSVRGLPPCPDSEGAWYRSTSYGIRRAAKWDAGSGGATLLGQPEYDFHIYDCTVPHGPPYEGKATFGSAWTLDDSGHIYGEVQVAYAEHQHYNPAPDDYWSPTVPAAAYSGFEFGGGSKLGDVSLVYDPEHNIYTTQGKTYYVRKVRNGVTMGYDSTGQNFVNSLPVDFVPTTMNSQGVVLGAVVVNPNSFFGYTKFLIYDPATLLQTELPMRASRFFGPGQFHPPVALNHRTIAVTNSSGQTTFKKSPQIVGPSGAVIWEEDPKTGQYFSQPLNLLIPPNSGWNLTTAKAINDNGVILCKGSFQGQTRACLLWPMEVEIIHHEIDPQTGQTVNLGRNTVLRDEVVDLRIKVAPSAGSDRVVNLNVSPDEMKTKTLASRGSVKMFDFGIVPQSGSIQADISQITLPAASGGQVTIKAIFNTEGAVRVSVRAADDSLKGESSDIIVQKRIRKYGKDNTTSTYDFNQHDKAFVDAAVFWEGIYRHAVDDVDRLKAIGMTESELGRNPQSKSLRPDDIMTIGHPNDHVLDALHAVSGYVEREVDIANNTTRTLNYPAANHTPASVAILYGTCWLYHKAQTITPALVPGPWRTWDNATTRYNGGGVPDYLSRVTRALQEGRHPTDGSTLWPLKTDGNARQ